MLHGRLFQLVLAIAKHEPDAFRNYSIDYNHLLEQQGYDGIYFHGKLDRRASHFRPLY